MGTIYDMIIEIYDEKFFITEIKDPITLSDIESALKYMDYYYTQCLIYGELTLIVKQDKESFYQLMIVLREYKILIS